MIARTDLRSGMVVWYSDPWETGYFPVAVEPGSLTLIRPDGTHFSPHDEWLEFSVRVAK